MEIPLSEDKLTEALRAISPAGCGAAAMWSTGNLEAPFPEEIAPLKEASSDRQQEFLCGRACARAAVKQLGGEAVPITMDVDRVPVWPEPFLGSISHSKGFCVAVAARDSMISAIGLDLERIDRLSPKAQSRVVHPKEADFVNGDRRRASLLFSAKEAFFKMQYPIWRKAANFQDLVLEVDEAGEKAQIRIAEIGECFSDALRAKAERVQLRFCYVGLFVVSVCWMPA